MQCVRVFHRKINRFNRAAMLRTFLPALMAANVLLSSYISNIRKPVFEIIKVWGVNLLLSVYLLDADFLYWRMFYIVF